MKTQNCAQGAAKYASDVVAGKVLVCKLTRLAVDRYLKDLDRSKLKSFPYQLDEDEANRVGAIFELLPHTKGKWAAKSEKIKLELWQKFLITNLYGWRHKKTGLRRFREASLYVPRKNGKSIIGSGMGIVGLGFDGEFGAEVYSGATSEKQAWEIFRPANLMIKRTPELSSALGLEALAETIIKHDDLSRFAPIIGKPGDGSSPSLALIDEYHEHATDHMVEAMQTGMGAREQPLLVKLTTAGTNLQSPCYKDYVKCTQVLEGSIEDDQHFCLIYGVDKEDDWTSKVALKKANPNYGVSVLEDFLLAQQKQAMQSVAKQNAFKTKHLNIWCFAKEALFNSEQIARASSPLLDIDDLIGSECYMSADLGSKLDLCAEMTIFKKQISGAWHYYMFGRYWLPEAQLEESDNKDLYFNWMHEGYLNVTSGASVDFELIDEQMLERARLCSPKEFIFDPHNAIRLGQKMQNEGYEAIEFIQQPQNFTVPLDDLQSALADGRFHFDGNPITQWCFANTAGRTARKGLMAPTKQFPHQKIDGAIAAIMGMSRAVEQVEKVDTGIFSNGFMSA